MPDDKEPKFPELEPKSLLHVMFATQLVILILAGIILLFSREQWWLKLNDPEPWFLQVGYGAGISVVASILLVGVSRFWPLMREVGRITEEVVKTLNPSLGLIIALSIVSGISEELLFRAALQPLTGIWIAAGLFALAHAFVPLQPLVHVVFVSMLFLAGVWIGIIYEQFGLLASMTFHTIYNFIVFVTTKRLLLKEANESGEDP